MNIAGVSQGVTFGGLLEQRKKNWFGFCV